MIMFQKHTGSQNKIDVILGGASQAAFNTCDASTPKKKLWKINCNKYTVTAYIFRANEVV